MAIKSGSLTRLATGLAVAGGVCAAAFLGASYGAKQADHEADIGSSAILEFACDDNARAKPQFALNMEQVKRSLENGNFLEVRKLNSYLRDVRVTDSQVAKELLEVLWPLTEKTDTFLNQANSLTAMGAIGELMPALDEMQARRVVRQALAMRDNAELSPGYSFNLDMIVAQASREHENIAVEMADTLINLAENPMKNAIIGFAWAPHENLSAEAIDLLAVQLAQGDADSRKQALIGLLYIYQDNKDHHSRIKDLVTPILQDGDTYIAHEARRVLNYMQRAEQVETVKQECAALKM